MRISSILRCSTLAAIVLFLASQCQQSNPDVANVKTAAATFTQALTDHDANTIASLLTSDVTEYDLTKQEAISGSDNVLKYLTTLLPQDNSQLHISIEQISIKGPDLIRARGLAEHHNEQTAFSVDFKKEEGTWRISQISHLLLQPAPSHYEQLQELNWLVGSWVNQDADTSFHSHYQWDTSKNFLEQEFTLIVLGHKQLSGKQLIGWDPTTSSIRSWIFDTDGGFGESRWTKDESQWYVSTAFTLADGRKASATHIFTPVDNNTYTFTSVSRDVDGALLPNIGPFTIIRESAQ